MNKNKHVIDMIFPIALFFVFISSCFIVLILSFHTYRKTVQLEQSNYQTRTALSYITQKIHQNDLIDSVSLQQIDQKDVCLLIFFILDLLYFDWIATFVLISL